MNQMGLLWVLVGIGFIWTLIWLKIVISAPKTGDYEEIHQTTDKLRRRLLWPMIGALAIGFVASLYFAPYPWSRKRTFGEPEVFIDVDSFQWAWIMSSHEIPVGKVVQFNVTAQDVNHGFGVYTADNHLLTQVQAMPGHVNRLIYQFDEPGMYFVRCLEYCSIGHHGMVTGFNVV